MLLHGATIAARHAHPHDWRSCFIGSALASRLLKRGERITGLDNLNDYYRFVD